MINYYSFFEFDTKKRAKYSTKTKNKIVKLKQQGVSIRQISKKLDIPFGSIHYILRMNGEVNIFTSRPSNKYMTRSEAMYYYDITNSQFDYYRGRYKDRTVKKGNVVYIERDVFEEHILDKQGYKNRYLKESKNENIYS